MTTHLPSPQSFHDIIAHYQRHQEADRLFWGVGVLERVRTQEIVSRYLPPGPTKILDVGGGPGTYAAWLLQQGYRVDLVDLAPNHIAHASRVFQEYGPLATARVGDARHLEVEDESYDSVLLLGPLYHLTRRADRVQALAETRRVLRPGGYAFAAAISRFASMLDGFLRDLVGDPDFVRMMDQDLVDGQHLNPPGKSYFTTAYFHRPEELASEVEEAGLLLTSLLAVEGPFWCMGGFAGRWANPDAQKLMLETMRRIEAEPSILGVSAHWVAVVQRAG